MVCVESQVNKCKSQDIPVEWQEPGMKSQDRIANSQDSARYSQHSSDYAQHSYAYSQLQSPNSQVQPIHPLTTHSACFLAREASYSFRILCRS